VFDIGRQGGQHAFDIVGRLEAEMLIHLAIHRRGCQGHHCPRGGAVDPALTIMRFLSHYKIEVSVAKRMRNRLSRQWATNIDDEGIGAGDGNRTHDTQLGKLMFYL